MDLWALAGLIAMAVLSFAVGVWGTRQSRTTSDFLVARRLVRAEQNAAAISGEYLSAASFLGVAGLILAEGVDALWYPIGFTAGYLALLLFVAAPLRRSGAYTMPDFVQARLDSIRLRQMSTAIVVIIGWLYLAPQLQGAGRTLSAITGIPFWVGTVSVAGLVLMSVLRGGMRSTTLVQAVQYWLKLFAITFPAFVLFAVFLGDTGADSAQAPAFDKPTAVEINDSVTVRVNEPMRLTAHGMLGPTQETAAPAQGAVYLDAGTYFIGESTELSFPANSPVPTVINAAADGGSWNTAQDGGVSELFETYSLIFATFLGTLGLPHVLVRFYTNPTGNAARRTTLFVLALLGVFYLFPTVFGMLSRTYLPRLLVNGETDAAVPLLPSAMLDNWFGGLLTAIVSAGAFAAFLSTSAGLLVSISGVLSTDLFSGRVRDFRLVSVLAIGMPSILALAMASVDISRGVALAFAMAASTLCPMLVLGIWWRNLTAVGAAWGAVVGGGITFVSVLATVLTGYHLEAISPLLAQPAVVSVPLAFLTMIVVSKATQNRKPPDVSKIMLRMHAPDRLGFIQDRMIRRFGKADVAYRMSEGRHRID